MNIPDGTLDQLFKGMKGYNPTTYEIIGTITKALEPIGLAILGLLFMLEISGTYKRFAQEDGTIPIELLGTIALKYAVASALILGSGTIINFMLWVGIQGMKWVNSLIDIAATSDAIPQMGDVDWWAKPIVFLFEIFAYGAMAIAGWITNVLIFLRMIQFYIAKAIAPIFIAFFVSEELRSIAVGFFKHVGALVLQGLLIVIILGLIPILTANDYLGFGAMDGDAWANAGTLITNIFSYFTLILKYVVIVMLLIGSQGLSKRLAGAS
jgi:hypothetical protein